MLHQMIHFLFLPNGLYTDAANSKCGLVLTYFMLELSSCGTFLIRILYLYEFKNFYLFFIICFGVFIIFTVCPLDLYSYMFFVSSWDMCSITGTFHLELKWLACSIIAYMVACEDNKILFFISVLLSVCIRYFFYLYSLLTT